MKTKQKNTTGSKLTNLPRIVSREEWQRERDQLLVKEKALTRAHDTLAAERRRLPMVKIEKDYTFDGPTGKVSLLDLFEGRRQLIIYHFMFAPDVDGWPTAGCPGCSMCIDYFGPPEHLHARDTSLVLVSLGIVATPFLIDLIAPGFTGETRQLTITLVQILFPGVGTLVLSAWCLGILNSHGRFLARYSADSLPLTPFSLLSVSI